jgi:hypothetical protein
MIYLNKPPLNTDKTGYSISPQGGYSSHPPWTPGLVLRYAHDVVFFWMLIGGKRLHGSGLGCY